jgi:protein phosphatase
MLSAAGPVRERNEDSAVFVSPSDEEAALREGSLALVADGMGGHAAGEVASALAVDVIRRVYYDLDAAVPKALASAFAAANRVIFEYAAANPHCSGMGTTATALAFRGDQVWLAHVGDSRAYLLRNGSLSQLSKDQTLAARLIREGVLTREEAATSPVQNVILQALGTTPEISPQMWKKGMPLMPDDVLILCSDGLSNMVADADIAALAGALAPREACEALMQAAIAAGGHDNVSIGVFRVSEAAEGAAAGHATRRISIAKREDESAGASAAALGQGSDELSA